MIQQNPERDKQEVSFELSEEEIIEIGKCYRKERLRLLQVSENLWKPKFAEDNKLKENDSDWLSWLKSNKEYRGYKIASTITNYLKQREKSKQLDLVKAERERILKEILKHRDCKTTHREVIKGELFYLTCLDKVILDCKLIEGDKA